MNFIKLQKQLHDSTSVQKADEILQNLANILNYKESWKKHGHLSLTEESDMGTNLGYDIITYYKNFTLKTDIPLNILQLYLNKSRNLKQESSKITYSSSHQGTDKKFDISDFFQLKSQHPLRAATMFSNF